MRQLHKCLQFVLKRFCSSPVGFAICCFLLAGAMAPAQDTSAPEYQVKGAFLYQFTKFVDWPASTYPSADSPFVIAVVGKDPFGPDFAKALAGKTADGRPLVFREYNQVEDVQPCQILFVSSSDRDKVPAILARLGTSNTLTVSDFGEFIQRGGIVNFYLDDDRVRFEINPDAAGAAGLQISSKLLSLAKVVKR